MKQRCDFVPSRGQGSQCRNKALYPWPGQSWRMCRKHKDAFVADFEHREPWLVWYLKYGEITVATQNVPSTTEEEA